jgi:3-oxoacyl-[acyl-carrier-protein] synthase-3
MSVITSMMQTGAFRRGLLVAAETNTKNRSMKDRTVRPLFGDAATVTALEYDEEWNHPMNFVFGVDGAGAAAIIAKYGGMRHPTTVEALREIEIEPGVIRRGVDMEVRGMDVFGFAIKRPPASLRELVATFNIDIDSIDFLYLHQANKFIDEKIRKSLKVPAEKVPYCIEDFGNVTSASIPLTMVSRTSEAFSGPPRHCIACGFGVGLAWASMEFTVGNVTISPIVEM